MPNSRKAVARRAALRYVDENGCLKAPVPEDDHGKRGTYDNHKCRCIPCSIANTEHSTEHRDRVAGITP